jgi:hypothetical protein
MDLFAEVTAPNGTRYKWDANQPPGSRAQNLSFVTKIGEGFSVGSCQLARRADLDYPDLELGSTVTLVGADGSVAFEGRISALPRAIADSHSIGVTLTGWVAHLKDRKFTEIYVDRDLAAWVPPSMGRKATMLAANLTPFDGEQLTDPTDGQAGVATAIEGAWSSVYKPHAEIWYDAGPGLAVRRLEFTWKREGTIVDPVDTDWGWGAHISSDDKGSVTAGSGELRAAGPSSVAFQPGTTGRYALFEFFYRVSPAGSDGVRYAIDWYKIAAYGNHFLPLQVGEADEPSGVFASDVIRHIVNSYCPMLNTDRVQDTSYVIQHLTFKERTFPYDAILEVNKYHLWHFGVWEDRTVEFRPYDMTNYVWEVRTDDPGTRFDWQGRSTEDLFNGIVVTYTDLSTGIKNTLTPLTNPELGDTNPDNLWNQIGMNRWDEISLSTPTLAAQAIKIGQSSLVARNRPKTPGTITAQGYIRDRVGNPQPVWKVRAGDTISITNFPDDTPRLIHEATYNDQDKTLQMSVDAPASDMDAEFDRVATR